MTEGSFAQILVHINRRVITFEMMVNETADMYRLFIKLKKKNSFFFENLLQIPFTQLSYVNVNRSFIQYHLLQLFQRHSLVTPNTAVFSQEYAYQRSIFVMGIHSARLKMTRSSAISGHFCCIVLFVLIVSLRERLRTHKVPTKDQCLYLNYHKFSINSYVLDVY